MAATSGIKTGIKSKMYRNTGTYGSPTWVALDLVKDAKCGHPWTLTEADVRATPVKLYAATQIDFTPSCLVRCDNADTGYLALCSASETATPLDILQIDGALTDEGSKGIRASFIFSMTEQDQSIGSVLYKNFDMKPGFDGTNYPKLVTVGASSAITMTTPG